MKIKNYLNLKTNGVSYDAFIIYQSIVIFHSVIYLHPVENFTKHF